MPSFTIPSIYTAIDKFSGPVKRMKMASRGFSDSASAAVDRVNRKVNRLIPAFNETSKQFLAFARTAALAAAIIGGVTFTVDAVKDYESAIASAQAITGTTTEQFIPFKAQIKDVAKVTKKSTVDIAKGFEIVGSAKPELLKSAEALGAVTKSAITLSKASGDELETSAKSLTGVMNQFSLAADQSHRTMNVLAAGSVVGSANITNVAESMKTFGAVAAGSNLTLEQSVALVEVMGKYSLFGSEAGNKLKGSILRLQKAGMGYASGLFNVNDALLETQNRLSKLRLAKEKDAFITRVFGAENVSAGKILLDNIALYNEYTKGVTNTSIGIDQAKLKTDTFTVALAELKAGWVNIVTSSDQANSSLHGVKRTIQFVSNNLESVVKWTSYAVGGFLALKVALFVAKTMMAGYNVALGIYTVLASKSLLVLRANTIAMAAAAVTTKVVTAAQWLWNAAMTANPIGLIIVAIAALTVFIADVIDKWDEWGATVALFMGPLGLVISLIQSFRRNWEMVSKAFETEGILGALKAIGKVILDAILMPFEQFFNLLSKIPGLDFASKIASQVDAFRTEMGTSDTAKGREAFKENYEAVNPEKSRQQALARTIEEKRSRTEVVFSNTPPGTRFKGDVSDDLFPDLGSTLNLSY